MNNTEINKVPEVAPDVTHAVSSELSRADVLTYVLMAIGFILLIVWLLRGIYRKRKFGLSQSPGRMNNLNPIGLMGLILLYWLILPYIILYPCVQFFGIAKESPSIIVMITITQIVLFLWLSTICFTFGMRRGMGFCNRHWWFDSSRAVAAYLMVFPVCVLLSLASKWFLETLTSVTIKAHPIIKMWNDGSDSKWLLAFIVVVLAPLTEEIFFRGFIQSSLRTYLGPWIAVIGTSLLFGLAHVGNPESVVPLIALSIILGYNYERTGRLWSSILIHMIFNAITILCFIV